MSLARNRSRFSAYIIIIIICIVIVFTFAFLTYVINRSDYVSYSIELKQNLTGSYRLIMPIPVNESDEVHDIIETLTIVAGNCTFKAISTEYGKGLEVLGNGTYLKLSGRKDISHDITPLRLSLLNETLNYPAYHLKVENQNGNPLWIQVRVTSYYFHGHESWDTYKIVGYITPDDKWQNYRGIYESGAT